MDNNLPNTQLDDQKMENLRKRTKLSKYIMIAGGVCLGIVVLMILLNGGTLSLNFKTPTGVVAIILIIGGFALLFTGLRVKQKAGEAQKHIANNYASSVLGRVMDRLDTFDHGKHIDRYYLNQDFGFPKYDCTGFCGDYVRGVLRGVPMEFCEFELQEKHVTEDKDGDTDVSYETVFYGVIVVCRHNLALSDAVMATQFKTYENAYNADSEAFYNAFSVRCTSEQDAKARLYAKAAGIVRRERQAVCHPLSSGRYAAACNKRYESFRDGQIRKHGAACRKAGKGNGRFYQYP